MTISLRNQDPIEIQRVPTYGRGGTIRGAIKFDEESLTTFEKVKLVVRLLVIYSGMINVDGRIFLDRGANIYREQRP